MSVNKKRLREFLPYLALAARISKAINDLGIAFDILNDRHANVLQFFRVKVTETGPTHHFMLLKPTSSLGDLLAAIEAEAAEVGFGHDSSVRQDLLNILAKYKYLLSHRGTNLPRQAKGIKHARRKKR